MTSIKLRKSQIIEACQKYISTVDVKLNDLLEDEIAFVMRPYNIFGFKFGGKTREQAEKIVTSPRALSSNYRLLKQSYDYWLNRVIELKTLCEMSESDMIDVDIDDLKLVMPFLKHDDV